VLATLDGLPYLLGKKVVLIKMIQHQKQQGKEAAGGKHPGSLLLLMGCQDGKAKNLPSPDPFLPLDSCLLFIQSLDSLGDNEQIKMRLHSKSCGVVHQTHPINM